MNDKHKIKAQLTRELEQTRKSVAELERKQVEETLNNLIEIIQFTEQVSTKMHGLVNEAEIYRTVKEEFVRSKQYTASLLLLTDDDSSLRIAEASLSPEKVKEGEKATGLRMKGYKIDLKKSSIYRQVVREGKTVQARVSDIIGELFPRPLANLISKTTGYEKKSSILTPLKRHGKIIGAFAMTSSELAEYFIPSVINLAQHISNALEWADECSERKQVKETLEESERRYRELVEDASDVVYTTDPDGYFTYVNPPAEKLTGYSKDVLIGMHFTEIVSPEWRDRVQSFYLQQRDNLVRNSSLEFPILTRKGEEKWIEQKVTMLIDRDQLTGAQSIVRDITERKRAEEALREMATIDPLTSLYNRRRFSEFLAHEIDRTKRYKTDLSIIMFDIDHFKKINDTYGHAEGDNVLKMFGARMKKIIRESDIIARWGGEEFMILAVNCDLKNAQIIAEKIRVDIESQQFASAPKFTVSAGVTQFGDSDDVALLIDRADKALYQAKNNGRNQVQAA